MKKKKLKKKLKSGEVRIVRIDREAVSELLFDYFLNNEAHLGMAKSKKKRAMHFVKDNSTLAMAGTKKHDIIYSMHWHGDSDELTLMACRTDDYRHIDLRELERSIPLTTDSLLEGKAYRKFRLVRVEDEGGATD